MSTQPTLFDPPPGEPVLRGTVVQDGRTYTYTLHPERLSTDRATPERAPSDWSLVITFELTGLVREVRNYARRDALWAVIRERADVRAALGVG